MSLISLKKYILLYLAIHILVALLYVWCAFINFYRLFVDLFNIFVATKDIRDVDLYSFAVVYFDFTVISYR